MLVNKIMQQSVMMNVMRKMNIPKTLNSVNPVKLADILFKKNQRVDLFLAIPEDQRFEYFASMTPKVKNELLAKLPVEDIVKLLEPLDPDDATDVLQSLSKHRRDEVLQKLSTNMKESLSTLLEFDPETAAGLMTLDYVQIDIGENIESAAKKFRSHEKSTGRPPVMLVMDEGKLKGYLPGHELGFAAKSERIDKLVKRIPSISYAAQHKEVLSLFDKHPHSKVVVLNDEDHVIGIIYSDEMLKLIQKQEASTLYDFAGIHAEESVTDTAKQKVKNRYKWLIINLGTAFLAAATVGLFEGTLEKYVLLAVYMPIVAGMGGNAATQTLAVQVRGISLKQISLGTAWRSLKNELGAAFINGLINAVLVALVVIVVNDDYGVAVVLALAMIINMLVASVFGTMVPLVMAKLGKDPAASATIFITTATDVLGFLAFLGLATWLLG